MTSSFHLRFVFCAFQSASSTAGLRGAKQSRRYEVPKTSARRRGSVFAAAAAGLLVFSGSICAQNACDLNNDGVVNSTDVQLAVNMTLGIAPCNASVDGSGVCDAVVVQRVVNAADGGGCLLGNQHSVSLTWAASASQGVVGYNIYRAPASTGPYAKINSGLVAVTDFTDTAVQSNQTYYYVTTAVNSSNVESGYSNQAQAVIPYP